MNKKNLILGSVAVLAALYGVYQLVIVKFTFGALVPEVAFIMLAAYFFKNLKKL